MVGMGMTELVMYDAAKLPDPLPKGNDVWAGYIGGNVDDVWPDDSWRRVSHFPKLPIYGARTDKTGTYCGLETIMALYKLGVPHSTAVAVDLELFFNGVHWDSVTIDDVSGWLNEYYDVLKFFGYITWKYGSTSYLFRLPPVDGSWVATDSGVKEQFNHAGVHATQY